MITLFYASLLAFLLVYLAVRTILERVREQVALGDGGKEKLKQCMRGHANLAEYAPLFLILLLMLEVTDSATWVLHLLGASFFLGRLLHAYTFTDHEKYKRGKLTTSLTLRRTSMILTFVPLLGAAGLGLYTCIDMVNF